MEEFRSVLRREPQPQTPAMLDGIRFENLVQSVCEGQELDSTHEWYKPVTTIAGIEQGGQYQVKASREIVVDGVCFVCYGILDFLKAGIIYDTKLSKTYKFGKYLNSPQHPMYFYLCPEVREFQYLVSDGKDAYCETYRPDDVEPIEHTIRKFMQWLDKTDNVRLFCEHRRSKYA